MKTVLLSLILFLFSATISIAEENPYSAHVFFFKGDVKLSTDGGEFATVESKEVVSEGDIIKTGKRSFAVVRFPDKSTMRVDQNSEIKIENIVERVDNTSLGSSDVFLKAGRAVIDVINKSKAPVFNVRTNNVSMGVRGTRLLAGIDPSSGTTDLAVERGEVEISRVDKPEIRDAVLAGEALHVEKNKSFTQPQSYKWVKDFDFNTQVKNLDHFRNEFVAEAKRKEFSAKKKPWKRDEKRWSKRSEKWKKLRAQYLRRSDELKEKRKEFRESKKKFKEKRKKLVDKRNKLIVESKELRKEALRLKKERANLSKETRILKTSRNDPRKKMELSRKRRDLNARAKKLKDRRESIKKEKKALRDEKRSLVKEKKASKKKLKKLRKRNKRDLEKVKRMRKRNKKKMMLMKKKMLDNRPPSGDGAGSGGNSTGH